MKRFKEFYEAQTRPELENGAHIVKNSPDAKDERIPAQEKSKKNRKKKKEDKKLKPEDHLKSMSNGTSGEFPNGGSTK